MNHHEAKFLLRAYRPGTADARDPVFSEAIATAANDPALKAWLDRESAFDRALSAKLREVQPPSGLREAILAGSRASQRTRAWWKNPAWMALAASIAIVLTLSILRFGPSRPSARDFAEFALHELATEHRNHDGGPAVAQLQARLTNASLPLPGNAHINGEELRRAGCRMVKFNGHDVFEICFNREGIWYHLYATRVEDLARGTADAKSLLMTKGRFAVTAWKDAKFAYALVTAENAAALRRLI